MKKSRSPRLANKVGRKRRAAGWAMLTLGVIVAGVWVASGWWCAYCINGKTTIGFSRGSLLIIRSWSGYLPPIDDDINYGHVRPKESIRLPFPVPPSEANLFQISSLWSNPRPTGATELQAALVGFTPDSGWEFAATNPWAGRPGWSWTSWSIMGSGDYNSPFYSGFLQGAIRVVVWPLPLLLITPAALLLRSGILARRRVMTGQCSKCGYSLAGLGADTPCPECGKGATITA